MHVLAVIAMSLGAADLSTAWVDRRFVIYSDPPGAQVFRNGVLIGNTPVDDHFVYYGKYQFTLVRDKCQTMQVVENISSPWYDLPGIDFFSENLLPYKLRDVRYLYYRLEPLQPVNQEELLRQALKNCNNAARASGHAWSPARHLASSRSSTQSDASTASFDARVGQRPIHFHHPYLD